MEFNFLDNESENLLKELLAYDELPKKTFRGYTIDFLVKQEYVVGACTTTFSDIAPCYLIIGITQKGKSYFEMKKKYEKEKRRFTRREWMIAVISAIIGALIGQIISFTSLFL
ncbi:MAG: hypothetical protein LUH43_04260 [Clostridia bacterium]|nr:hypothetical protein [Clostridia bacterium]